MTFCISFTNIRYCIMDKKLAIIVWVWWQDWTLLWNFLKSQNYAIIWIWSTKTTYDWIEWTQDSINILDKIQVNELIKYYHPDEIYYFAAYHHSSQDIIPSDAETFKNSTDIHVNAYFNFLEAVSLFSKKTKICYASSCLIYWGSHTEQQNELTLPVPNWIYGITKLEWMHLGNWFAEKYKLQVINAILYNHESEFRSPKFVSMKIIDGAIKISKWLQDKIVLWDLSTKVDRWYAWDYVQAMYALLQTDRVWDYIIWSWSLHTIQDLVEIVFEYLGLDWKQYVVTDQSIIQRKKGLLFGDTTKVVRDTGWKVTMNFKEMIVNIIKKII